MSREFLMLTRTLQAIVAAAFLVAAQASAQDINFADLGGGNFGNSLGGSGGSSGSGGKGPAEQATEDALKGIAKSALSSRGTDINLPAHPALNPFEDKEDEEEGGGSDNSKDPRPEKLTKTYIVPAPLKGVAKELDSEAILKHTKDLLKAKLTKFMITASITEPSAALALQNSMLIGNAQLESKLDVNNAILAIADAADPTGQTRLNYLSCMKYNMKDQRMSFNQAISECTGDQVGTSGGSGGEKDFSNVQSRKIFDFERRPEAQGAGQGGKKLLLSDILFGSHTGDRNKDLKDEFKKYLGDIEFELNSQDGLGGVEEKYTFKDPEKLPKRFYKEKLKEVWKQLLEIQYKLCDFKKNGSGATGSSDPSQFNTPIIWEKNIPTEMFSKISMEGFLPWPNLLEQMFALFQKQTPNKILECDKIQKYMDNIPEDTTSGGNNDQIRDWTRIWYFYSQRIAFGQVLSVFQRHKVFISRFPIEEELRDLMMNKIYNTLGSEDLAQLSLNNIHELRDFLPFLAQMSQSNVGGTGSPIISSTNNEVSTSLNPGTDRRS